MSIRILHSNFPFQYSTTIVVTKDITYVSRAFISMWDIIEWNEWAVEYVEVLYNFPVDSPKKNYATS